MKSPAVFVITVVLPVVLTTIAATFPGVCFASEPIPVIFDTDMDTDCDDAGAMALLHIMADRGEVEILATMVSATYRWSVPCVEAINHYYGRPNLPIGCPKGKGASDRRGSRYARQIADWFESQLRYKTNADAPDAVKVYRTALAQAKDKSVVIVSVGYLTNLRDLLVSPADDISTLTGRELVQRKVARYVCMGGRYPESLETGEWGNFKPDADSTVFVVNNFPTTIYFSGDGDHINTGALLGQTPADNPVRLIYQLYLGCDYASKKGRLTRPSWDLVTLLYAVRPDDECWKVTREGYNHVFTNGTNQWRYTERKDHVMVQVPESHNDQVTKTLDQLIITAPAK